MSDDDKILKILDAMNKRFDGIDKRFDGVEQQLDRQGKDIAAIKQEQNRTATALDSLKAGQDDISAAVARKQDVKNAVNTAKEELRNEIEVSRADAKSDSLRILGKLDKQSSRIEDLEKTTGTPNRHKN